LEDAVSKSESMKKVIFNIISRHSNINQSIEVKTGASTMTIFKTENLNQTLTVNEGLSKSIIPSFCSIKPELCQSFQNISITVSCKILVHLKSLFSSLFLLKDCYNGNGSNWP
jgi:hypothetical protein